MVSRGRGGKKYRGGGDPRGRGRGGRGGRGGYSGGRGGFSHPSENIHHSFSLADEAKNTERHHGNYAGNPLRHTKITFIAAGHLEPSDLLKPLNANVLPPEEGRQLMQAKVEPLADSTEGEEEDATINFEEADSPAETSTEVLQEEVDMQKLNLDPPEKTFIVDVIGDSSLRPKEQTHFSIPVYSPVRSPSPIRPGSASSSSSEKIVFIPRKMRPGLSRTSSPVKSRTDSQIPHRIPSSKQESPPQPTIEQKIVETVTTQTTITTVNDTIPTTPTINLSSAPSSSKNIPFTRATQGNKRRRKAHQRKKKSEEDAIIEDYIENVATQMRAEAAEDAENFAEGELSDPMGTAVNRRDLGGDDSWSSTTDSEDAAEDSDAVNAYKTSMWEEHELDDLEGLSTSSEGPKGPVDTVLGKRERPSGVQYLIKWSGYETDDATWVLAESLDPSADPKVVEYEEILIQKAAAVNAESTEDSEEDGEDEDSGDDEKLARFLQRQVAMGITESDLELNLELDELMDLDSSRKGKGKGKPCLPEITPNRRTGRFPSASRFADAYDDFDPMEWERPSLTSVKKGRVKGKKGKNKLPFLGLSDSELEDGIHNSWQKDREKKKARKAEREALRAEGLLGAKGGKRDAKAKWKEGMNMEELKEEIMAFLLSENQSIALPPMHKSDRKLVHTFAGAFGLKSKSVGGGKNRFTTLYKTSHSSYFEHDEDTITAVMNRKRFFGRPDAHVGRGGRNEARSRGAGGGGVVHHREGDIVGASAPEIAEDNKGRRMLEKMGYRSGMALGMDGNKGIVVPVAAVVKISKAGLG